MEAAVREALEEEVRRRCHEGDVTGGATAAIRGYGPEIYSLLCALHRDEDHAAEVFSSFSEKLWRGLPSFAWQCSLRTWAYTIARNTSHRFLRGVRRERLGIPLSELSGAERLAEQVRTRTRTFMRTETKDRLTRMRESLPEADQILLVLRIDRGLEWIELSRILSEDEAPGDEALKREAVRLRKRFQLLKQQLVERARREGLLRRGEK